MQGYPAIPVQHTNNLSANNLFAALAITYSTCAFHFRSSLIITPKSLCVPTRSTSLYPTHIGRNEVTEFVIKFMYISLHFFWIQFHLMFYTIVMDFTDN